MTNSIVTGYSDDEMMGLKPAVGSENAFNYDFANCIIRTPEVEDKEKAHYTDVVFEDVKDTVSYGYKHFLLVDANMQLYDFHLRKESAAIDKANVQTSTKHDHDGHERGDKPDVGAYEYTTNKE